MATIRAALAHGINVIDTAPVYGFGRSEEIVGKALTDDLRQSRSSDNSSAIQPAVPLVDHSKAGVACPS